MSFLVAGTVSETKNYKTTHVLDFPSSPPPPPPPAALSVKKQGRKVKLVFSVNFSCSNSLLWSAAFILCISCMFGCLKFHCLSGILE